MITLREIERTDLGRITAWRGDRDVVDTLEGPPYFVSPEVDEAWYDSYLARRDREIRCAICLEPSGEHVGNVYLLDMDIIARSADFHIFLAREHWGKGLGKKGTRAMLEHGFRDRNLQRIQLRVLAGNARAIGLYEDVGFVREGLHRRAAYKRGSFVDVVSMAILVGDFEGAA